METDYVNIHAIHLVSFSCYVLVVYCPPSNSLDDKRNLLNFLKDFCVNKEVMILCDFNLSSIIWCDQNVCSCIMTHLLCSLFQLLHQWVKFPTFLYSNNILDLVLSTEKDGIGNFQPLCPLPGCGHIPIVFNYYFMMEPSNGNDPLSGKCAWFWGKYNSIDKHILSIDQD